MLTGRRPKELKTMTFYEDRQFLDIITGNLFDGDKSYSMVGFTSEVLVRDYFTLMQ